MNAHPFTPAVPKTTLQKLASRVEQIESRLDGMHANVEEYDSSLNLNVSQAISRVSYTRDRLGDTHM
jgi:hypothetical protein